VSIKAVKDPNGATGSEYIRFTEVLATRYFQEHYKYITAKLNVFKKNQTFYCTVSITAHSQV
jgi:hypothetical protein